MASLSKLQTPGFPALFCTEGDLTRLNGIGGWNKVYQKRMRTVLTDLLEDEAIWEEPTQFPSVEESHLKTKMQKHSDSKRDSDTKEWHTIHFEDHVLTELLITLSQTW